MRVILTLVSYVEHSSAERKKRVSQEAFLTSKSVKAALTASGKRVFSLGKALGGEEILCAEAGGEERPAILITAGAHSPEVAGVIAALRLLTELRARRKTYVIPMRDPFGFNDFSHCLGVLARRTFSIRRNSEAVNALEQCGTVLWQEEGFCLALVDGVGVAAMGVGDEPVVYETTLVRLHEVFREQPSVAEALRGRHVLMPAGMAAAEGAGSYGRTYTAVVSPQGQILSLSQFFGRSDAPAEVAGLDDLVKEAQPGITFDCHEDAGRGFYLPARRHEREPEKAERIVLAMHRAVADAGHPLADFDEYVAHMRRFRPYWPPYYEPSGRPGLFWVDGTKRGIGYILVDYVLRFGFSMPIETGWESPLAVRVDSHMRAVLGGVAEFEAQGPLTY